LSDSYARGGQPRSVPDPDRDAYEEMVRKQRTLNDKQHGQDYWSSHPGIGESLIPVWGSTREAIADLRDGDYIGAAGNAALAVTDVVPAGTFVKIAGKGIIKGAIKAGGSHTWNATRKWMTNKGLREIGLEGHHAIIPQGGWGKHVPDVIKNQPYNITFLPKETHRRIHTRFKGEPRFDFADRVTNGAPPWGRAAMGMLPQRPVTAVDAATER
jgi:hypothetical protein